jgi:hypothetical protein
LWFIAEEVKSAILARYDFDNDAPLPNNALEKHDMVKIPLIISKKN